MESRSHRAKHNMTKQLKARLSLYQNMLKEREKTVKKIKVYAKYKIPGYQQHLARELAGINKVKKDISDVKVLILRRQKNGQIYRVL